MRRGTVISPIVVSMLFKGKMTSYKTPKHPERANFVICCDYGDWSSFRTLADCEKQYKELEASGRPDGYYWVEER
jgi:hypothetical protein